MNQDIKRYTSLASLIAMLKNKELTLIKPSKWDDKNDTYYLDKYREKKGFKDLYVLCFTNETETSHHWKAFAPGADGVCVRMKTKEFMEYLETLNDIKKGDVCYMGINDAENHEIKIDSLPFLKRYAFRHEKEYRIIFGSNKNDNKNVHNFGFDVGIIDEISLSHSLPKELKKPVVELLKSIDGCSNLTIHQSTLNENTRWKNICDRAR